mmetsp:Transcript_39401/g.101965  ORF Transcript_39401/g.101965 Transcript_39401/m.101965 type:complete len:334 (+) Transcript_39401:69-1070(+)
MSDLAAVGAILESLQKDDAFHRALEYPEVMRAVDHWSGRKRLPPEQCEDWLKDPRLNFVFGRVRQLETECKRAGIGVPLDTVLARGDQLVLPDGRIVGKQPVAAVPKRKPRDIRRSDRMRCISSRGVAYRSTPDVNDRDASTRGPYQGDIICIKDRQEGWVRTDQGWLPLEQHGKALFRELVDAEKKSLMCICPTGVAIRKSKNLEDRDASQIGPREGESIQYEEQDGEWVRTETGWLPLFKDGEPLFEEDRRLLDDALQPKPSWKKQLVQQLVIVMVAVLVPRLSMWYFGTEAFMAGLGIDLMALNLTNISDSAAGHAFSDSAAAGHAMEEL